MSDPRPVLVATAIDPASDEALRQGAELATATDAPLVACHVLPEGFEHRPLFPHLRDEDRRETESLRAMATTAFEEQVRRVLGECDPAPTLRLEAGSPHAVLLEVAEEMGAGMIVVGPGAPTGEAWLGGVAERVVRHAHCPVLLARPARGATVVAATDFSDAAVPAIEAGDAEARRRGLPLVMLHVVEPFIVTFSYPEASQPPLLPLLLEARADEATARLAALATRYSGRTRLERGSAARAIVRAAGELSADLLVVGTHGRTGLRRLALGSVAEAVIRKARCSVLVVRLAG